MNDTDWKLIKELTDENVLGTPGLSARPPRYKSRAVVINGDGLYAVMYTEKFNLYTLPGGGIEAGETPEEALKREILEETGCTCDHIEPLGIVSENRFHADYTVLTYYFIVRSNDSDTTPQLTQAEIDEGTCLKWCSFDDALRLIKNCDRSTNQRKFFLARDIAALKEYSSRIR